MSCVYAKVNLSTLFVESDSKFVLDLSALSEGGRGGRGSVRRCVEETERQRRRWSPIDRGAPLRPLASATHASEGEEGGGGDEAHRGRE